MAQKDRKRTEIILCPLLKTYNLSISLVCEANISSISYIELRKQHIDNPVGIDIDACVPADTIIYFTINLSVSSSGKDLSIPLSFAGAFMRFVPWWESDPR